jgi:hypothetical protein
MIHEELHRDERIEGSSDRSFGFVFAVVFAIIAAWPLISGGGLRRWALAVAVAFLAIALLRPVLLAPLNRRWMAFGLLLARVVSPVALGILFFVVFWPIGLVMRLFGADPLRLRRDAKADSYWIRRQPPGPPPQSMDRQF